MDKILFKEDLKKIEDAVEKYPLGSYQIGEIARLSGLMYERGINVAAQLEYLCELHMVELEHLEKGEH